MLGIALEGGGARGAYQVGVVKALYDSGYSFDGYTGTSIGAINSALLAQGDFNMLEEMWNTTDISALFDIDDETVKYIMSMRLDRLDMAKINTTFSKVIKGGGADTSKIRALLSGIIDEKRIRESGKDFGLVTVSLPDFRPFELMLEDIPAGKLIDYVMASSCFPGFKSAPVGAKHYIDGGFFDNIPVNMLAKRGYEKIIAIRTMSPGVMRKLEYPNVELSVIAPAESLGPVMLFSREKSKENMKLGYFDGLRFTKKLGGSRYYVVNIPEPEAVGLLVSLGDKHIAGIAKPLGISGRPGTRLLLERVLPEFAKRLGTKKDAGYDELLTNILEYAAKLWELPRFREYSFEEFVVSVKEEINKKPLAKSAQSPLNTAALRMVAAIRERVE